MAGKLNARFSATKILSPHCPEKLLRRHDFYSYDAKYLDEKGAQLVIPAALPKNIVKAVQELALRTFKTLACEGMARVDFFLRDNREIFVNEINTIPGFTKISMYPKLWEASGIPYGKLDRSLDPACPREVSQRKKTKNLSLIATTRPESYQSPTPAGKTGG